jgi:transcriptional regulator with XRE-family HTH domain
VLQLSRSNYSQIELGNQFPTFHTLHILARYYSKSYEWLLHGYQIQETDRKSNPETIGFPVLERAVVVMNNAGYPQLSVVDQQSRLAYMESLRSDSFLQQLDTLHIPLDYTDPQFIYRAFKLAGMSLPALLDHSDILIGRHLSAYKNLVLNNLYVIVTHEDICIARFLNINSSNDGLVFKNNNNSTDFILPFSAIQEIWESYGKFTTAIDPIVNDMELNLRRFENTIRKLEKELNVMRSLKSV